MHASSGAHACPYSHSHKQRRFYSRPSRPLLTWRAAPRPSGCGGLLLGVAATSFSASDNVLVTYVLTAKRRDCQIFSTLRSGGPLADGRQDGLDRAPDPGPGRPGLAFVPPVSVSYLQPPQTLGLGPRGAKDFFFEIESDVYLADGH
jgi:hypothetical protein